MITITSKSGEVNLVARGIYVQWGGIEDFLGWAPAKTPPTNDWYEGDGEEVDLDPLYLDKRTIKIPFVSADPATLTALRGDLLRAGEMTLTHDTGIARAVYFEQAEADASGHILTCRFTEYAPARPGAHHATPRKAAEGEPTLDGTPLSSYGFARLADPSPRTTKAKTGTTLTTQTGDGAAHFPRTAEAVRGKQSAREVRLDLYTTGKGAIANYLALIQAVTAPGLHRWDGTPCYYRRAVVADYDPTGEPLLTLRLTLRLTLDEGRK